MISMLGFVSLTHLLLYLQFYIIILDLRPACILNNWEPINENAFAPHTSKLD